MPDPFQNVSAAGPEFIEVFARQLEVRAAEPAMVAIVEAYLDDLPWDAIGLAVEVGCGTGPTARRMAARSAKPVSSASSRHRSCSPMPGASPRGSTT